MLEWAKALVASLVATPFPTLVALLIGALGWMSRKWVGSVQESKEQQLALITSMLKVTERNGLILEMAQKSLDANEETLADVRTQLDKLLNRKPRPTQPNPAVKAPP
jgi:DNA-binding protein H-NS